MSLLIFLFGLVLLVAVHELGHMLVAKALGVRVNEFAVGFGPVIFKRRFGQTVYSLRAILLGGFAKMAGMNAAGTGEDPEDDGPDTYDAKAPWRRALIIFAGPFANVLATVVIFAGISVVSGIPTEVEPTVQSTVPNTLAAESGLRQGDRLVSVNGNAIGSWEQVEETVARLEPGQEATLIVERDGERFEVSGALTAEPQQPDSAIIGIAPVVSEVSHSPLAALWNGVEQTVRALKFMGALLIRLLTGDVAFYDSVSGPVGIATVGSQSVSGGYFFQILALISINLAVFNLLPVLPLDGGHLLFIAAEKVMGRRPSMETVGKVATLGVVLLLGLMLFATYADLSKLISGQPFIPGE